MANWSGMLLTDKGRNLQAKVESGSVKLELTKMKVGSGILPDGQTLEALDDLIAPKQIIGITAKVAKEGGLCQVRGVLTNIVLVEGFYIRELGLFADDPDLGEILYGVMTDANPDYIPKTGTAAAISQEFALNIVASNAEDIIAVIDGGSLLTEKTAKIIMKQLIDEHNANDKTHKPAFDKHNANESAHEPAFAAHNNDPDANSAAINKHNTDTAAHKKVIDELRLLIDKSGLNLLQRSKAYEVGDRAFYAGLPSWACLECVTAGTTASTDIVLPQNISGGGALVVDGTVLWIIDDMRELCTVGDVVGKTYLPQGYVKANGATVQRADYPRLVNLANRYNLWTTTPATYPALYGKGNGSTTFVLPDWRGVVMRFVDDGKGYDPGRVLGTYQADAMQNLTGSVTTNNGWTFTGANGAFYPASSERQYKAPQTADSPIITFAHFGLNAALVARTAAENRMKNTAVLAVMRY